MAASQHPVILFAQHEVMPRNQIRSVLQDEGYDVLAAADGSEALELFRAHAGTIDLLLTAVELPAVDGLSAYRQIQHRTTKHESALPVRQWHTQRLSPAGRVAYYSNAVSTGHIARQSHGSA